MAARVDLVEVAIAEVENLATKLGMQAAHGTFDSVLDEFSLVHAVVVEHPAGNQIEAQREHARLDGRGDISTQLLAEHRGAEAETMIDQIESAVAAYP